MTDITRTVGEIRMFVQSVDRTAQPHLALMAGELSRACAEVNDRLSRCAGYLRQGLRSEALQLARTPPDLLDLVAVLDFPERADWDGLALAYGWPQATPLAIDLAEAVNEAYALEDPLEDLLRNHRRLALARAPLPARLEVIRQINELDPNNTIWAEDVRLFEAARISQIEHEVRVARARLDSPALAQLSTEVETSAWLTALPGPVVTALRDAVRHVKREEARAALRSLLDPLDQARIRNDATLGRQLRGRWLCALDDAALTPRDPLWGQADVALDWLAGEDRRENHEQAFRTALQDLEQAVDDGAPHAAVAAREQAVREFGLHVPHDFEAKLQERYRELGRQAHRRNHWVLATVGGTTLVLIGVVAWANLLQKRERAVRQDVGRIESLIETGHLEEARSVLEGLESSYQGASQDRDVAPVVARLNAAERQESERVGQFAAAMTQAQRAPILQEDVPALATARALARQGTEKAQVEQLAGTRRAGLEHERARLRREVMASLETATEKLTTIETSVRHAPEDSAALGVLRKELRDIEEPARAAGEDVRVQVARLVKKGDELEAARAASVEREQLLAALARAAGAIRQPDDVKAYIEACRYYKDKFPSEARSSDLVRAMEDQAAWERVAGWTALARTWPAPVANLTPRAASERVRRLTGLGEDLSEFPDRERIARYRRYVESRARLSSPDEDNPTAQIQRLFANPLVKSVYRVTTTDGRSFYSLKEPKDTPAGTRINKLVTIDCQEKQQFIHQSLVLAQGPAPQSALAKRVLQVVDTLSETPEQWDAKMADILFLVRKDPDVDPVLKVILLKGCLQAAVRGDTSLEGGLKAQADRIEQSRLNLNVTWVDPDDDAAHHEREKARVLLAGLPGFGSCVQSAEKARRELEAEVGHYYVPIGLLLKDSDGAWHCRGLAVNTLEADELWVVGPKAAWTRVGKGRGSGDDGPIVTETKELLEGQLVFAQRGIR
ncbi:MAG: hypothetical protein P4L84_00480 [Isosphaeraceae bacterium]|nr:hypothetical protein [Isosphaeraceae bacterium]